MTDLVTTDAQPVPHPSAAAAARRNRRLRTAVFVVAGVGLGLVVAIALVGRFRPHLYAGTVLQGDEPAPALDGLAYADGTPVDLGAYDGEVVLVFFGYTNCPDVCPTTLADAAGAVERLGTADAARTNLIMVSVDPARDDLATLDEYVAFFDAGFRGAGGTTEAIDRAASAYGVFYRLDEPDASGDYLVDHTGTLMGVGPDGAVRVIWGPGIGPDALAADIEALLS
jgi:protein SCO1/2